MGKGIGDHDQRRLLSEPASARAARMFVGERLRRRGAPGSIIADMQLVASELVTNLIVHGDGSHIDVAVLGPDSGWWQIEVAGGAHQPRAEVTDPAVWRVAPAESNSGRGLGIVRRLADDVVVEHADGRLIVKGRLRRT